MHPGRIEKARRIDCVRQTFEKKIFLFISASVPSLNGTSRLNIYYIFSCIFAGCDAETETFTECGTACPATCENYQETNRPCTRECVRGCFCNKGLVRRSDRKCVKPDDCERMWHSNKMLSIIVACIHSLNAVSLIRTQCQCNPEFEEYNACGTACPKTCEQPEDRPCTRQCVPNCFCPKGLLRRKDGKCVKPDQCT